MMFFPVRLVEQFLGVRSQVLTPTTAVGSSRQVQSDHVRRARRHDEDMRGHDEDMPGKKLRRRRRDRQQANGRMKRSFGLGVTLSIGLRFSHAFRGTA
jgi:hypothetical protein